jgi:hypothetical protein
MGREREQQERDHFGQVAYFTVHHLDISFSRLGG